MFMAWVGPCIISELVESTIGPPPADPTPTITSSEQQPSTGEDAAAAILAQAMNSVTVDENDPLLQRQHSCLSRTPLKTFNTRTTGYHGSTFRCSQTALQF